MRRRPTGCAGSTRRERTVQRITAGEDPLVQRKSANESTRTMQPLPDSPQMRSLYEAAKSPATKGAAVALRDKLKDLEERRGQACVEGQTLMATRPSNRRQRCRGNRRERRNGQRPADQLRALVLTARCRPVNQTEIGVRDAYGNIPPTRRRAAGFLASPEGRDVETLSPSQMRGDRDNASGNPLAARRKPAALAPDTGTLGLGTAAGAIYRPSLARRYETPSYAGGAYTVGRG